MRDWQMLASPLGAVKEAFQGLSYLQPRFIQCCCSSKAPKTILTPPPPTSPRVSAAAALLYPAETIQQRFIHRLTCIMEDLQSVYLSRLGVMEYFPLAMRYFFLQGGQQQLTLSLFTEEGTYVSA
jgi:hypothetical protein